MIINNNNFILLEIVKVETDLNDPLPALNSFNLGEPGINRIYYKIPERVKCNN